MSPRIARGSLLLLPGCLIAIALWIAGVRLGGNPGPPSHSDAANARTISGVQPDKPNELTMHTDSPRGGASLKQPLALFATQPGRNSREGAAKLGASADDAKTYSAGALLANGMRIAEIHPTFVVLQGSGVRQRLHIQGTAAAQVGVEPTVARDLAPPLHAMRDALSEVIRAVGFYDQDQLIGIELHTGACLQVFAQLGLRAGDVVIEIDGAPVTDVQQATQQLRAVIAGSALPVRIRRDGSITAMTLDGAAAVRMTGDTGGSALQ